VVSVGNIRDRVEMEELATESQDGRANSADTLDWMDSRRNESPGFIVQPKDLERTSNALTHCRAFRLM